MKRSEASPTLPDRPEGSRGVVRIVSNYARMSSTFLLGICLVKLQLGFGSDAFGLIVVLGASIAMGAILKDMLRASIIPELGSAYHADDKTRFPQAYNTSILFCSIASLLTALIFVLLYHTLSKPWMNLPAALIPAAQWFVCFKGVQAFVTVLLATQWNLYAVSERMVAFNCWTTAERVYEVAVAFALLFFYSDATSSEFVVRYGMGSSLLISISQIVSSVVIISLDCRFRPQLKQASWNAGKNLLKSAGANSSIVLANNLYVRLDAIIVNVFFGLFGSVVFGLASRLTGYVRMMTMGLVTGVDAVSARISSSRSVSALREFMEISTRLQGTVVLPAIMLLFVLTEPLIQYLIGRNVQNETKILSAAVMLVHILLPGIAARSLSEGWIRILAGAGRTKRYSKIVLCSAAFNPLFVIGLIILLPESLQIAAPCLAYSLLFVAVNLGVLPFYASQVAEVSYSQIYRPLLRPLLATLLASPVFIPLWWMESWTPLGLITIGIAYFSLYMLLIPSVILSSNEREHLKNRLIRYFTSAESQPISNSDIPQISRTDEKCETSTQSVRKLAG